MSVNDFVVIFLIFRFWFIELASYKLNKTYTHMWFFRYFVYMSVSWEISMHRYQQQMQKISWIWHEIIQEDVI